MNKKLILSIFIILLTILVSGCSKPKLEDVITVPKGYYLSFENDPKKNSELKSNWQAEDVVYVVYKPEHRKNAKNILTISKYPKQEYPYWLNKYMEDKIVKRNKEVIQMECNLSFIFGKDVQICQHAIGSYSIHKYTFGLADMLIVRILCYDVNTDFSKKHCEDLIQSLVNRAKKLKLARS